LKPRYFATPEKFRAWLAKNHASAPELLVGFYKKDTGKPSITWPQSVDEALCYGWIDGVRRSLGPESYTIRFTPRRPRSVWSSINIARVKALTKEGRMAPAGTAAYERRSRDRSKIYAYEQRDQAQLTSAELKLFKSHAGAFAFFEKLAPSYRQKALYWVTSASKRETRASRLEQVIASCVAEKKPR
jgi:uncharacterized protein YdeI (YjbR/CyaY-like superfamily)